MKRILKDTRILPHIQGIKSEHPFRGYRRLWAYMKYRLNWAVNKKRIYRIMKEHSLLVNAQPETQGKTG